MTADKANLVYIPEPSVQDTGKIHWCLNKDQLIDKCKEKNGNIDLEFKRMYIRMECG